MKVSYVPWITSTATQAWSKEHHNVYMLNLKFSYSSRCWWLSETVHRANLCWNTSYYFSRSILVLFSHHSSTSSTSLFHVSITRWTEKNSILLCYRNPTARRSDTKFKKQLRIRHQLCCWSTSLYHTKEVVVWSRAGQEWRSFLHTPDSVWKSKGKTKRFPLFLSCIQCARFPIRFFFFGKADGAEPAGHRDAREKWTIFNRKKDHRFRRLNHLWFISVLATSTRFPFPVGSRGSLQKRIYNPLFRVMVLLQAFCCTTIDETSFYTIIWFQPGTQRTRKGESEELSRWKTIQRHRRNAAFLEENIAVARVERPL